jgi:hypothetical protein
MKSLGLTLQTAYADLIDRCQLAEFDREFPANGSFSRREQGAKVYWNFNYYESGAKRSKYVGIDSEALRARIARHGRIKADHNERKALVASLARAGMPQPDALTGAVTEALAQAGVFRLGGCLVGTVAYQAYAGLLGVVLHAAQMRTTDLDVAQHYGLSIALEDTTPPIGDVLGTVDPTFRPVPHVSDRALSATFVNEQGYRVDFLTPNRGKADYESRPARLPALGSIGAKPLRFLDFLIDGAVAAALLYRGGVLVNVPRPERFALHKLIVAVRRQRGAAKIDKDLAQAAQLVEVLAAKRAPLLADAWAEGWARGPTWRKALADGAAMLPETARDVLAAATGARFGGVGEAQRRYRAVNAGGRAAPNRKRRSR